MTKKYKRKHQLNKKKKLSLIIGEKVMIKKFFFKLIKVKRE